MPTASGADSARNANQAGTISWLCIAMNSQLAASPRMAGGTHHPALSASTM